MKLSCFSLVNFNKSGGATIRISGIINALTQQKINIRFYSKSTSSGEINSDVDIVNLNANINKRVFQFIVAYFPIKIVNLLFKKQLTYFKQTLEGEKNILFFEYLDITIGYWLKMNKVIDKYFCDVHGIAHLEFELNETKSIKNDIFNRIKKITSIKLDCKVFRNSDLIIYPSPGLQKYMIDFYNIGDKKSLVVSESINQNLINQKINTELKESLVSSLSLDLNKDAIILFAGSFKPLGGIVDLVRAYIKLRNENNLLNTSLILVGDGKLFNYTKSLITESDYSNEIHLLGRQPYSDLKTYQSIADIIICPDKDTKYSQILPHIKYFDSLASGKIVINGYFEFTDSINPNEKYSLNFIPSNVDSLKNIILKAIVNKKDLQKKYSIASEKAIEHFNYNNTVNNLILFLNS